MLKINIIRKMKSKDQWVKVILLIIIICSLTIGCSKPDPETDFAFEPSSDSKGMVITGYNGNNVNVVIPAKIQKLPVVEIGGFFGKNIISVILPNSTIKISNGAFMDCKNLTSIVIPASVKEIGYVAFQGSNLSSITFKGMDIMIETLAFQDCRNLDTLVFSTGSLKPLPRQVDESLDRLMMGLFDQPPQITEHYTYNPSSYRDFNGRLQSHFFAFHSGTSAFYGCDKLPKETISKLKEMGFLTPDEIREIKQKADQRIL